MPATADDVRAVKDDVCDFYARTLPVTAVGITRTSGGFAVLIDIDAAPGTPLPANPPQWSVPVLIRYVTGDVKLL